MKKKCVIALLLARAFMAGVASWEQRNAENGELCCGGIRYWLHLNKLGLPILTDNALAALQKALMEKPA